MEIHKLLKRQLKKYLPDAPTDSKEFNAFVNAISEAYESFEKDIEISNYAFNISEKEFIKINLKLESEAAEKRISIQKLKETLLQIDDKRTLNTNEDDLIGIVHYVQDQVEKRKATELELKKNINSTPLQACY